MSSAILARRKNAASGNNPPPIQQRAAGRGQGQGQGRGQVQGRGQGHRVYAQQPVRNNNPNPAPPTRSNQPSHQPPAAPEQYEPPNELEEDNQSICRVVKSSTVLTIPQAISLATIRIGKLEQKIQRNTNNISEEMINIINNRLTTLEQQILVLQEENKTLKSQLDSSNKESVVTDDV